MPLHIKEYDAVLAHKCWLYQDGGALCSHRRMSIRARCLDPIYLPSAEQSYVTNLSRLHAHVTAHSADGTSGEGRSYGQVMRVRAVHSCTLLLP